MKHFEKLENFVKSNKNWEEILKPNMKSIYPVEGRNWVVLKEILKWQKKNGIT